MPTVKCFLGLGAASSSKTPATIAGVNSFDERPYRPPMTGGIGGIAGTLAPAFDEGRDNILVKRLADRAGLLGAVERGDSPGRRRQGREEARHVERTVEPDLDQPQLAALRR